jgi:hypothetical protein
VKRVAGLVVLAILAVGVGVGEAVTPSTQHALLIGDSIMHQTAPALERQLGDGWTVHDEGVNGSGLLTPALFDWPDRLDQVLARTDPDVVVFLMIGNYTDQADQFWATDDGRPIRDIESTAFARAWGREADAAMARIAETGASVVLVLPPPMATEHLQTVVNHLRAEYRRVARDWPFVRLVDANAALAGPDGTWALELPTAGGDLLPVRTADTVHLAPHGQRLLARVIKPEVVAAVR